MKRDPATIRWHQPALPVADGIARSVTGASPTARRRKIIYDIVRRVGIPVVDGAETATELAVELLKLAAEVEQALMVQYLYASTSVSNQPGPDSVNYREKLLAIAIQEMGHLATVQNLLLLVGGRDSFYLQRDLKREASPKNPIPFVLEPISLTSLAKYVAAERPAQVPPQLEAKVDELVRLAEQDAGVGIHRVGVIYELLTWIFTPPDETAGALDFAALAPLPKNPHLSDEDLRDASEISLYEALPDEWQVFAKDVILATTHSCAEARDAITRIAEQGEGLQHKEISHFGEFMQMVAAFEAGSISVNPIARSPTLGAHGGQGGEVISYPYTRCWGEVFSLQYNLLVLSIYHALVTPRPSDGSAGLRDGLIGLALFGMRRVIRSISDLVASLPLRADGDADLAGPPYDLDPSILESSDDGVLRDRHRRILDQLESVYKVVENSPEFATNPRHSIALANLRAFDKHRRDLFSMTDEVE